MIEEVEVNGMVFIAQTTFYAYSSQEHRKNGKHMACTSSRQSFEQWQENARVNPSTVPSPLGLVHPFLELEKQKADERKQT